MIIDPSSFTTWAEMRGRVLRHAPDCPSIRLDDALKEAAREFFEKSRVWRNSMGVLLTTVADTTAYAYTAPTNAEVHDVIVAWDGTSEIEVANPGDEDDNEPGYETDDFKIGARPTDELYLTSEPASADTEIQGVLCFKPSVGAAGIPTEAWTKWKDSIACGAAALLVTETGRPWSAPDKHAFLRDQFRRGIRSAGMTAGPRRNPLRTTPL